MFQIDLHNLFFNLHHYHRPNKDDTMNKALISPATIERLLGVDTSFFAVPSYSKKTKNGRPKDTFYLKNLVRFVPFCKSLDQMNQEAGLGFVVGRAPAEAAWCKAVIKAYKKMDGAKQEREGKAFWANLECLSECLRQVCSCICRFDTGN